jgi:IS1 family transposase
MPKRDTSQEALRQVETAERKAVIGSPDVESLTTSHVERVFLSVRQELKRFQRKGLGFSKDLETHKRSVDLAIYFLKPPPKMTQ